MAFDLEQGSEDSISFIKNSLDANDEAFYSNYKEILQYKWKQNINFHMMNAVFYLFYVFLIDIHVIME